MYRTPYSQLKCVVHLLGVTPGAVSPAPLGGLLCTADGGLDPLGASRTPHSPAMTNKTSPEITKR